MKNTRRPKQKQKTMFVHNMFWSCIFLVLKSGFNEQSVVILWVNWLENECFWHRFTCTNSHYNILVTLYFFIIGSYCMKSPGKFSTKCFLCNLLRSKCTFNPVLCQPLQTLCSIKFPLCTAKSWQNYVWCTLQSTLFKPFSMQ